jgi:hypothetical protein
MGAIFINCFVKLVRTVPLVKLFKCMVLECVHMRLSSNEHITISDIITVINITCFFKGSVYRFDYITIITANNKLERTWKDKVVARYYVLWAHHQHSDGAK